MLKRWAAWPSGIRWLAGIVVVVLAVAIVWALFVPLADWLARHDVGSAKPALLQTARDAARGRLLTLVAGLFAAGALVFTALNFNLAREGQVTDRYTKAIEQLGSDKLDVRIGGIYALERIARDSAKDHPTVVEVLTAFIREHSREQRSPPDAGDISRTEAARSSSSDDNPLEQRGLIRPDVRAAVTVIRRRDAKRDILAIDLAGAYLVGAYLGRANLTFADLTRVTLTRADLREVILAFADLTDADLTGTDLTDANLTGTRLRDADLTGANLTGANLTGAIFTRANLIRAKLIRADLATAYLADADLTSANLTGANLTGVVWPEGVQVPGDWTIDGKSGRLKRAGQLSEVTVR